MRDDGIKNPEDIWDFYNFEDAEKEIKNLPHNLKELINDYFFTPESQNRLDTTREFCSDLSENFKTRFLELLDNYQKEKKVLSPKIKEFLYKKDFTLPKFILANGEQAENLLDEYNLDSSDFDSQNNLLLSLQLPKPLAQFWQKGGAESWGNMSIPLKGQVVEWGHFYRELMPTVWQTRGFYEEEKGLTFERINLVGEHDPKKYYYVWEVSNWQ